MEPVKDFLIELKSRVTNPLYSSILISWIFWNWKLIIGLTLYKNNELIFDGYLSYLDYISQNYFWYRDMIVPVLAGSFYTWVNPHVKGWIKKHNTLVQSERDSEILKATAEHVVRASVLFEKESALKEKEGEYARLTDAHKSTEEEKNQLALKTQNLQSEINVLKSEINLLQTAAESDKSKLEKLNHEHSELMIQNNITQDELSVWKKYSSTAALDGKWSVTVVHQDGNSRNSNDWEIKNGEVKEFIKVAGVPFIHLLNIELVNVNIPEKSISGIYSTEVELYKNPNVFFLSFNESFTTLTGTISKSDLKLTRISSQ